MKHHVLLVGSVVALLGLSCGGDPANAKPAAPEAPASNPAKTPVPAAAPATDLGNVPRAPEPGAAAASTPQDPQKPLPKVRVDAGFVKTMMGREPTDAAPAETPSTPEKVALGKALFHDKGLSKDGSVSCASCHDLGNYGVDGKVVSAGAGGVATTRNTPTVWNAARQFRQFWDGRGASIEKGLAVHAAEASVFGVDEAGLVAKVKANAEHAAAFAKAFPEGESVTAANVEHALGAFLRTLVTKSRFDSYLDGDTKALTGDELYGLKTFLEKGCLTCHLGRLAGGHAYQKTGVQKPYSSKDEGRALLTKSDADKFFFKVPSLLNVERTGPYLHDGKVKTLEETVRLMADIQLGQKLSDDEVRGIVAFLKALTGPLPADIAPPAGK